VGVRRKGGGLTPNVKRISARRRELAKYRGK